MLCEYVDTVVERHVEVGEYVRFNNSVAIFENTQAQTPPPLLRATFAYTHANLDMVVWLKGIWNV